VSGMLRALAIIIGILLIFAGVAGFLPDFTTNGLLFGYFLVDNLHNIFHIVTGVLAIMAATNINYTRLFFQVFGIIYSVIAIVGFWRAGDLYLVHVNFADNVLHTVIGVVALYLGFFVKKQ
jgi:hypothetical protein